MAPRDDLNRHLSKLDHLSGGSAFYRQADSILADPQAHIDALVEAGVLWKCRGSVKSGSHVTFDAYAVVQPHKHEWRVRRVIDNRLDVECETCPRVRRLVPNRLPIEVPE